MRRGLPSNNGGPAAFLNQSHDHLVQQTPLHPDEHIYHQATPTISHIHEKYQQQQQQQSSGGAVMNTYTPPLPPLRNGEVPMTGTLSAAAINHHYHRHNPVPPALPVRNGMATLGPQRSNSNSNGAELSVGNGHRTMSGRHFH